MTKLETNINFKHQDLLDHLKSGQCDVFIHGANCFHTMGSGVAGALVDYTGGGVLKVDREQSEYGDINKLGSYTLYTHENGLKIYNLYTQYTFNNKGVKVHWRSVEEGLCDIISINKGSRVSIPLIGCGLAGGEPRNLVEIITYIGDLLEFYEVSLTIISNNAEQLSQIKEML